jgi:hypothetical protein
MGRIRQEDRDPPHFHEVQMGRGTAGATRRWWRDANNIDPLVFQPGVTPFIAHGPIAHIMRQSIDLDADLGLSAVEVEHVCAQRMLPAKLYAFGLTAKLTP